MKRLFILTILVTGFAVATASAAIINVPGDYPTIQQAVDSCDVYDTVMVANGTYYENVWIDRVISLFGENRENTVIDGSAAGDVVIITYSGVDIRNFTITSSGNGYLDAGIEIRYADSCIIECCDFENNFFGLSLYGSSYSIIERCKFLSNESGIQFREDSLTATPDNVGNAIENNIIQENNSVGILFDHTLVNHHTSNLILGNRITSNAVGISTIMSQENLIAYNVIGYNTGFGESHSMCFGGGQYNQFHHNIFGNNNDDTLQACDIGGGIDYWYSVADSEGNYWSDYTGPDNNGDGIGDIPYDLEGGESQDLAPLMDAPFSSMAGQVTDGEDPIEGVLVQALGTVNFRYTDINGMYTLEPLGAGMYDISFSHALFRDTVVADVPATLDFTTALDMVMEPQTGTDENEVSAPERFTLFQNYPNPFNSSTTIEFLLEKPQPVTLTIYDLMGREVKTLSSGEKTAGRHRIQFDASSLPSGVYFYRLKGGDSIDTRRMVLLR